MIYLVVPVHNGLDKIKEFIKCVNAQTVREKTILVLVDCGSVDGSTEWSDKCYDRTIILRKSDRVYCGEAFSFAYKILKGFIKDNDVILLMNTDGIFNEDFVEIGSSLVNHGLLVTSQSFKNGVQFDGCVEVKWGKLQFTLSDHPNVCSTRGLFLTGRDFIGSGGFSRWLPHYCSDYEFTHRLWRQGFKIVTNPKLRIEADGCSGIEEPRNLKELFSIRCPNNPIYKTIFVFLSCPARYWIVNILRAWSRVVYIYPFQGHLYQTNMETGK
jgi:GT2 family glycosyltransferase